jgi:malonate transporter and related proteins
MAAPAADGPSEYRYERKLERGTTGPRGQTMEVVDLVLPVFAVIVTGWLAGQLGYISRSLADGLVHFAYNVAMPALLFVTVAQEPARHLLEWRFLLAFGGGSILCFVLVLMAVRIGWGRDLRSGTMFGMSAAMTNTGFVALPILHAVYGQPAVLPAAIATLFVAAVMFPLNVILLEIGPGRHGPPASATLLGVFWAFRAPGRSGWGGRWAADCCGPSGICGRFP